MFCFSHSGGAKATSRLAAGVGLLSLCALALAGCGGGGSSHSSSGGISSGGGSTGSGSGGSGSFTAQFTNASGTNANTASFDSSNVGGGLTEPAPIIGRLLTISAATTPSGSTARTFNLVVADTAITAGKSYPLGTDTNSLSYVEATDINSRDPKTQRTWISSGGSAVIDSIDGKTYKLHITDATMGPTEAGVTTPGTGTFTVNGHGTATLP